MCTKIITLQANSSENHYCENACGTTYVQNLVTLKANAQEIVTCKMHLTPNMYKIMTLMAHAKEIIT